MNKLNRLANTVVVIALLALLAMVSGVFYTVDEIEQVVITQFGEPIGEPVTKAGLYFKLPFIQKANYFDKRILRWDGDPNQIPTRDKRYIMVDTTARWRIVDPLKFMQTVRTETAAYARLDDIVDADVRDVISGLNLVETIRNTNRLADKDKDETGEDLMDVDTGTIERISVGRNDLTREILARSSKIVPQYGIELIDVRLKRVNYIQDVRKKVYDRMISERQRVSERYRSEGQGRKAEIEGRMAKELNLIRSEAYREAQKIKGNADAQAIRIFAEAYNRDPAFFAFLKTLENYEKTVGPHTDLILSTESDYYRYLKTITDEGSAE